MGRTLILGIESSCDETAAAVVENGRRILSDVIYSQIPIHETYGGVVPEIASRAHIEKINPVIRKALSDAHVTLGGISAIGVTCGPGLVGALLVGVSVAKAMAYAAGIPLVGVNHIEGHVCANFLEYPELEPPFMCLIVSGGHTNLAIFKCDGKFEPVGATRDDAAGEAFDKAARALGLGYPGGPKLEAAAKGGNPDAITFPRGVIEGAPYDFTFSGMKSAVLSYLNQAKMKGAGYNVRDVAASFQRAVCDCLVQRAVAAALEHRMGRLVMAGGVTANRTLYAAMSAECAKNGIRLYCPRPKLCTDNAAMIASAAYFRYMDGQRAGLDLNAYPDMELM